jgi:hypothetical protein
MPFFIYIFCILWLVLMIGSSLTAMPKPDVKDRPIVDGAANIQFIDNTLIFTRETTVVSWDFFVKRQGTHYLQVWRPAGDKFGCAAANMFTLVGQNHVNSVSLGTQTLQVSSIQRISVQPGDVVGWRHLGQGVISFDSSGDNVNWVYGESPGIGGSISFNGAGRRTYSIAPNCDGQC